MIYSYTGPDPAESLLTLISRGDVAGVIFFTDNVSASAHLAAVIAQLQHANASPTNPVRMPLLLMTDQEGGVVRRLPGAPRCRPSRSGVGAPASYGDQGGRAGRARSCAGSAST